MGGIYKHFTNTNLKEIFGETITGIYFDKAPSGFQRIRRSICTCGNSSLPEKQNNSQGMMRCKKCGGQILFLDYYSKSINFTCVNQEEDDVLSISNKELTLEFSPNTEDITINVKEVPLITFSKYKGRVEVLFNNVRPIAEFSMTNINNEIINNFFGEYFEIFKRIYNEISKLSFRILNWNWFGRLVMFINNSTFATHDWCLKNPLTLYTIVNYIARRNEEDISKIFPDGSIEGIMSKIGLPVEYIPLNIYTEELMPELSEYLPEFAKLRSGAICLSRLRNNQIYWKDFHRILKTFYVINITHDEDEFPTVCYYSGRAKIPFENYKYFDDFMAEMWDECPNCLEILGVFRERCRMLNDCGLLVNGDSLRSKTYNSVINEIKTPFKKNVDVQKAIQEDPLTLWMNVNASAIK